MDATGTARRWLDSSQRRNSDRRRRAHAPVLLSCRVGLCQSDPVRCSRRNARRQRLFDTTRGRLQLPTEFVPVDGAVLACRSIGSGPTLLAPECNYTRDLECQQLMARRFNLIVTSPRDFGASSRAGAPYSPDSWATDMLAVARHFGRSRFMVFGYSFTGAFGPWLAIKLKNERAVIAVAPGGFPLLGDYGITSRDVDAQMADFERDPAFWAELERRFDPHAGAAFYRDLATLSPDSLVDDARVRSTPSGDTRTSTP